MENSYEDLELSQKRSQIVLEINTISDYEERQDRLQYYLLQAINLQDILGIRKFLSMGASVNAEDGDNNRDTPMHVAVRTGSIEVVCELLSYSSYLDVMNSKGETLVSLAADLDSDEILNELVIAGAEIDITDEYGNTPLHEFAEKKNLNAVKKLLDAGAYYNVCNDNGETPISFSMINNEDDNGDDNVTLELLNRGADPNLYKEGHTSHLSFAIMDGKLELAIAFLNKGANPDISDEITNDYSDIDEIMDLLKAVRIYYRSISTGRILKMLSLKLKNTKEKEDKSNDNNIVALETVLENRYGQNPVDPMFSLEKFTITMTKTRDDRETREGKRKRTELPENELQYEMRRTRQRL